MMSKESIKEVSERISQRLVHSKGSTQDWSQLVVDIQALCLGLTRLVDISTNIEASLQELVVSLQEQE